MLVITENLWQLLPKAMTSADAFLMSLTFAFSCAADVRCECLFGSAKKKSEQLECFLLGKKLVLRLHPLKQLWSHSEGWWTFMIHSISGISRLVYCPSHAEQLTWVIDGLFSFPFLASVSRPFNEENNPFLCLPLWVSERVLFRRAESSLEHTWF